MLECARRFYNKQAIVKLKNILRHSVGEKRKKIHVSSNRERIGRYMRPALKETRLLSYSKTTNYF